MICKKCGAEMRLWLERPGFKSHACPSCEFVTITREDSATDSGNTSNSSPEADRRDRTEQRRHSAAE
jgi:ssDNA-binding Zn-finger/Zn-ribbon topoisomerase 1